jgi:hypothetical protein
LWLVLAGFFTESLHLLLSELLPRVALLPLNPEGLNTTCFVPRKDYDKGRLIRGQLQLPGGTLLLLDETGMKPGNITEHGVKNLQVGFCRGLVARVLRVLTCRWELVRFLGGFSCGREWLIGFRVWGLGCFWTRRGRDSGALQSTGLRTCRREMAGSCRGLIARVLEGLG